MQKITPFLWFDNQAEEAAQFYASIFRNSELGEVRRYPEAGPGPKGSVMSIAFKLEGQEFIALNGGPHFTFSPAISFFVNCQSQAEVDQLWEKLSAGGEKQPCGWVKDKFGVSWQVIPEVMGGLLSDSQESAARVMQAMLQMQRIDIAALRKAYAGEERVA